MGYCAVFVTALNVSIANRSFVTFEPRFGGVFYCPKLHECGDYDVFA
jgi:hypothetical protein